MTSLTVGIVSDVIQFLRDNKLVASRSPSSLPYNLPVPVALRFPVLASRPCDQLPRLRSHLRALPVPRRRRRGQRRALSLSRPRSPSFFPSPYPPALPFHPS